MKINKKKCSNCGKDISLSNFERHYNYCLSDKSNNNKKIEIKEDWRKENGKYECPFCQKEYSKMGISTHIWRQHTSNGKMHTIKLIEIDPFKNARGWNKGLTKEIDSRVRNNAKSISKSMTGIPGTLHTEETKEKIRKKRFEYLSKKTGKTAWERRSNGEMSYLEQLFYDSVIIKYNLLDKYDISYDLPCYPYFIDFAFINIKLAVEMDGKCHFRDNKRIEHDIKRDKYLSEKGWKMFRISYNDNFEEKISELLSLLHGKEFIYNNKELEKRLYKGKIKDINKITNF